MKHKAEDGDAVAPSTPRITKDEVQEKECEVMQKNNEETEMKEGQPNVNSGQAEKVNGNNHVDATNLEEKKNDTEKAIPKDDHMIEKKKGFLSFFKRDKLKEKECEKKEKTAKESESPGKTRSKRDKSKSGDHAEGDHASKSLNQHTKVS